MGGAVLSSWDSLGQSIFKISSSNSNIEGVKPLADLRRCAPKVKVIIRLIRLGDNDEASKPMLLRQYWMSFL